MSGTYSHIPVPKIYIEQTNTNLHIHFKFVLVTVLLLTENLFTVLIIADIG